jgi:hypothetical protein
MKSFYNKYKSDAYSQNGEDGVIKEALIRVGAGNKIACEFGACDGKYCSNTATLPDWTRILFDINSGSPDVMSMAITPENVNSYVPLTARVLSIDIDGNDYNVWKAYTGNPAIVIIEINSSIYPTAMKPVSDPEQGTAYYPMVMLGIEKGYFLLCHTGNLVFVANEYRSRFPEIIGDGLSNWQDYFKTDWL